MYLYNSELSIMEVAKKLDETGLGVIVFTDQDKKLVGIVTDGDLRRAFLDRKECLKDFINLNPRYENFNKSRIDLEHYMKVNGIKYMPLIDENDQYRELFLLNDIRVHKHDNYIVIMAGGLGTRLGDLTKDTPKPMLPVGDKPILLHIVEMFKEHGFSRFIFCLNHMSEMITNFFGNGSAFGIDINYIKESKRMGTAGALSLISDGLLQNPFFVTNADVLTNVDYNDLLRFHVKAGADATMCVKKYENQIPYACVDFDIESNNLIKVKEKPIAVHYVNTGIYAFNPDVLNLIPKDEFFDMPSLFELILERKKKVKAYPVENYWIDIGHPTDYNRANIDINNI